ncbi:hypothetical protein F4556_004854 [Kitasatospora gansuensis]|uniref:Uncharacterized protein n=1 Tax=Kitasatospora gansuensis TaxID=258050 RepID=A0A7W7WK47_9ACTN|nr:hypothetical protein [Kitasatospora gansuensis]MBB4949319.1 hypothetical protein [Kitasatospora gansuensis]
MDVLGVVLGLALLFGVGLLVMLGVGAVKLGKAAAAKISQEEAKARRAFENTALKAKSFAKPGAHGQISTVRLALRSSLDSTRKVLAAGLAEDSQLAESLQLLTRLDAHAAELDGELRALEFEPEAGRVAGKLPELRERADRITHAAESMRWAAQDRMQRFADDELARLAEECESEAGALRHWDSASSSASASSAPQAERPGIAAKRGVSAEELLGLTDLAQRLRKRSA